MNEVLKTIAAKYKDDIVHTASELIQRNSQSLHEGEVAAYVQEKMKELGYDKVEVDRYGNVFGTMKGTGGGSSVMLNCHMDVVYEGDESLWPYPPYSGAIAEGRVWGRGASDTKGTMAIQIYVPFLRRTSRATMICPPGFMSRQSKRNLTLRQRAYSRVTSSPPL